MSNNQTYTVQLNDRDLTSLIKSLSASDVYHQRLQPSEFSYPNELQSILDNNDRIKQILKDSLQDTVKVYPKVLDTLCPRPSETSFAVKSSSVVDGGILTASHHSWLTASESDLLSDNYTSPTYLEALKSISDQLALLNSCSFDKSIISHDEHCALMSIELQLKTLIHCDTDIDNHHDLPSCYFPVNGSSVPSNME